MSYDLIALAQRAKAAERMLALASSAQKNQALLAAADALERAANDILAKTKKIYPRPGEQPVRRPSGPVGPESARITAMADGMRSVAVLPDPVGLFWRNSTAPTACTSPSAPYPSA